KPAPAANCSGATFDTLKLLPWAITDSPRLPCAPSCRPVLLWFAVGGPWAGIAGIDGLGLPGTPGGKRFGIGGGTGSVGITGDAGPGGGFAAAGCRTAPGLGVSELGAGASDGLRFGFVAGFALGCGGRAIGL